MKLNSLKRKYNKKLDSLLNKLNIKVKSKVNQVLTSLINMIMIKTKNNSFLAIIKAQIAIME
jgi:hypothetical protein